MRQANDGQTLESNRGENVGVFFQMACSFWAVHGGQDRPSALILARFTPVDLAPDGHGCDWAVGTPKMHRERVRLT